VFKSSKGLKDASEYLQQGWGEEFVKEWWNSERFVPDGIVDGSTLWDIVSAPMEDSLVNYPYKGLNDLTYGIRPNEMVIVAAGSGLGKSQFMREFVYHILNNTEDNIGLLFLEETVRTTARSMMSLHANKLLHLPTTKVSDKELRESFEATLGTGRLFLLDSNGELDKSKIVSRIRYMAKGLGAKFVVLDHVSIVVAGAERGSEREALEEIMRELRILVKETGICLFVVSHLKRPEGKGHEEGALTSLAHLKGSSAQGNVADIVIGLERNGQHEDEEERHTTRVRVLKNRFSGLTGPACRLLYNKQTGRMIERFDEDAL
jgi:twinkle protein